MKKEKTQNVSEQPAFEPVLYYAKLVIMLFLKISYHKIPFLHYHVKRFFQFLNKITQSSNCKNERFSQPLPCSNSGFDNSIANHQAPIQRIAGTNFYAT